jgi:hypothetical protein
MEQIESSVRSDGSRGVRLEGRMTDRQSSVGGTISVVIARVVVPLWLALGAVLKLVDLRPTHLPAAIISWLGGNGIDLMFVLRFSIAFELVVALVMVLLAPLARWTGLLILTAFMPVLAGDILLGASSCGCFGSLEVNPWVTLVTDVTFLVVLAVLGHGEPRLRWQASVDSRRVAIVGLLSLVSVALAFGVPAPQNSHGERDVAGSVSSDDTAPLPADGYYMPDYAAWIGTKFRDLEIAAWIEGLPADLETGQQYVMFYRKDCEHCHELLELYFSGTLLAPTTTVAVPERDGWPTENIQAFPCGECRLAELPSGVDWFLKTPVLVRLADGIVECAAEVDPTAPECLLW